MPGGWWEGTLQTNGKTGMFPDNFVRVVDMNDDNTVILRLVEMLTYICTVYWSCFHLPNVHAHVFPFTC